MPLERASRLKIASFLFPLSGDRCSSPFHTEGALPLGPNPVTSKPGPLARQLKKCECSSAVAWTAVVVEVQGVGEETGTPCPARGLHSTLAQHLRRVLGTSGFVAGAWGQLGHHHWSMAPSRPC